MVFMLGGLVALVVILLVVFIPSMEKNTKEVFDPEEIGADGLRCASEDWFNYCVSKRGNWKCSAYCNRIPIKRRR